MKRPAYILVSLLLVIIAIACNVAASSTGEMALAGVSLVAAIALWVCTALRMKDMGQHPAWVLLMLIPIVNLLIWIRCMATASKVNE